MASVFGKAEYAIGRNRKNKILVYTSRTNRSKVYEFMMATKFKAPGLVSWKCVSCTKIRNDYRSLGEKLDRKVPLILVDNDIIKEDPEKPFNGEHFCNGRDAVDVVINRAKIEFIKKTEYMILNNELLDKEINEFAKEAVENSPVQLSTKEKKIVKSTLDTRCPALYHNSRKRIAKHLNNPELQESSEPRAKTYSPLSNSKNDEATTSLTQKETNVEVSKEVSEENEEEEDFEEYVVFNESSSSAIKKNEENNDGKEEEEQQQSDGNKHGDFIFGNMQDVAYDIELG